MGEEEFDDAKPLHQVYVDGFWMDETEVTNEQFAEFVRQTGYVTLAEKPFAGAPPGAGVFDAAKCPRGEACRDCRNWWDYRVGACWRIRRGRAAICAAARIIRWSTSPGRMRRRMPAGPASGCRPRLNGNSPPAADWKANLLLGR